MQFQSSVGTMIRKIDNYLTLFLCSSNYQKYMIAEKLSQDLWKIIQLISTSRSRFVNHLLINRIDLNENKEKELKEPKNNIK